MLRFVMVSFGHVLVTTCFIKVGNFLSGNHAFCLILHIFSRQGAPKFVAKKTKQVQRKYGGGKVAYKKHPRQNKGGFSELPRQVLANVGSHRVLKFNPLFHVVCGLVFRNPALMALVPRYIWATGNNNKVPNCNWAPVPPKNNGFSTFLWPSAFRTALFWCQTKAKSQSAQFFTVQVEVFLSEFHLCSQIWTRYRCSCAWGLHFLCEVFPSPAWLSDSSTVYVCFLPNYFSQPTSVHIVPNSLSL